MQKRVVYDTILSAIHNAVSIAAASETVVYDTILSAIHNNYYLKSETYTVVCQYVKERRCKNKEKTIIFKI